MHRSKSTFALKRPVAVGLILTVLMFPCMGLSCEEEDFLGAFGTRLIADGPTALPQALFEGLVWGYWADQITNFVGIATGGDDGGDAGDTGDGGV